MSYKIIYTRKFSEQLDTCLNYLEKAFSKKVAEDFFHEIDECKQDLLTFPYLGIVPSFDLLKKKNLRALISKHSIIFYEVNEQIQTIIFYALASSKQDYINCIKVN